MANSGDFFKDNDWPASGNKAPNWFEENNWPSNKKCEEDKVKDSAKKESNMTAEKNETLKADDSNQQSEPK